MKKKPFLTRMRMFIAAGSFVGLIGGWAMLAQAGEPISTTSATTTAALIEPAPTQPTGLGNTTGAATTTTTRTTTRPRLRTGGS